MNKIISIKTDIYPLLRLALPLALTGLVQSAVWFFETVFLAHLSPEILAAGSLVSWLFGTIIVIMFGALSSINILVAHKHGEKDQEGKVQRSLHSKVHFKGCSQRSELEFPTKTRYSRSQGY